MTIRSPPGENATLTRPRSVSWAATEVVAPPPSAAISVTRAVPSSLAVAKRALSGLHAKAFTGAVWASMANRRDPVAASDTTTVPSKLVVARNRPSGLHAASRPDPPLPRVGSPPTSGDDNPPSPPPTPTLNAASPVAASTTTGARRRKRSSSGGPTGKRSSGKSVCTIARRSPSGLNSVPCAVTEVTHTSRLALTSNTRTASVSGHEAATRLPSGLNDGPHTSPPAGNSNAASSSPVAGSHTRSGAVVAGGGEHRAVGAEGDVVDVDVVAVERAAPTLRCAASRMSTDPVSSGPSVTNVRAVRAPVHGAADAGHAEHDARRGHRAVRAPPRLGQHRAAVARRVASTAARASRMLRSGRRRGWPSRRGRARGRSPPAAPRSASRRWSTATKPPTRATTRATAITTSWIRSRRLARAWRATRSASLPAAHGRARRGWRRGTRARVVGQHAGPAVGDVEGHLEAGPAVQRPGSRSSSTQLAAASRRWPSTIRASRSSSIQRRSRGHSRSSASWATSTVGTRVCGWRSRREQPGAAPSGRRRVHRAVGGRAGQLGAGARRRRVGSPSALTTTSCSNMRRTAARSASSRDRYSCSAREAMAPSTPTELAVGGEREALVRACVRPARTA